MVRFFLFCSIVTVFLLVTGSLVAGLSFANPGVWEWSPSGPELSPSVLLLAPRDFLTPPQERLVLKPGYALKNSEIFVDFESDVVRQTTSAMGVDVTPPVSSSIRQYSYLLSRNTLRTLWRSEAGKGIRDMSQAGRTGGLFSIDLPIQFPKAVQAVVGKGKPNLKVTGSETISFSGYSSWTVGQQYSEYGKQSKFPRIEMKQDLAVKMGGTIGDKIDVDWDQSSAAATDLQNRIRIKYHGYDDEVIQSVDLGNTNLSIPNTQYVSYSGTHEGLFGIKTVAKLGSVDVTAIASKQEGKQDKQRIVGGAKTVEKVISDLDYKKRTYFFLDAPDFNKTLYPIVLENVQVYVDDRNGYNDTSAVVARAYRYNNDGTPDTSAHFDGHFELKTPEQDYTLENRFNFNGTVIPVLVVTGSLPANYVLAVAYQEKVGSGNDYRWIGDLSQTPLQLKMIAPGLDMLEPNIIEDPKWGSLSRYELKNFYYLGSEAIIKESFKLSIKRRVGGTDLDEDASITKKVPYIQVMGLDMADATGKLNNPDGVVDGSFVYFEEGLLWFPDLHPFAPDSFDTHGWAVSGWTRPDILTAGEINTAMYSKKYTDYVYASDTRYYLDVEYKSPQTTFSLGWNVLENSEVVTLNGVRLQRGSAYTIDYDTGELTLLTSAALEPGADVSVDFSRASLYGLSKSLLGISSQYKPRDELSLSTTWLYESKGTLEERPRLDQEPSRTIVGGLSGALKLSPSLMTTLTNALPLVSTREKSSLSVSGEFGVSIPNPNTRNEVYLDDMEGNKETRPLSLLRALWRVSSLPEDVTLGVLPTGRRALWWYNILPTNNTGREVRARDLFPELTTAEERDKVLTTLEFYFNQAQGWHGLTQVISWLGEDLTEMQYVEIWINDFNQTRGPEKEIKLDLGTVSEDAMWDPFSLPNGKLDTEDRNRNSVLDLGEDTGLDGQCDPNPKSECPCSSDDGTSEQYTAGVSFSEQDPNGDDYHYSQDSPNDFSGINGTECNGATSSSPTPDTEDLNGDGTLNTEQDYFELTLNLAQNSKFQVRDNGNGWRLFRIPLSDSSVVAVGQPRWDNVRHARLWFDGFQDSTIALQTAGIEIVGNRWVVSPVRDSLSLEGGERFYVGVINNKDNANIYQAPPIKIGEENGVQKKEQSLVLSAVNLFPRDTVSAFKSFASGTDYTQYVSLKFWVRGGSDSLAFIMRFGTDSLNFYEYGTPVSAAWESKEFKLEELSIIKEGLASSVRDTTLQRDGGVWFRLKGRPSFTNVQRITVGLVNVPGRTDSTMIASDSVWVDELRLTDVKKAVGTAERVFVEAKFADFLSVSTQVESRGEDFLAIGSTKGSGRRTSSYSASGVMAVHKFLPDGMFNIPLNFSFSGSKQIPKFRTGDDIVLTKEYEEVQTTKTGMRSLAVSFRKTPTASKWLRHTIEGVGLSLALTDMHSANVSTVDSSRSLSGTFSYQFSPGGRTAFDIPLGHGRKISFFYLPSSISFTGHGLRTQSKSYQRSSEDPMDLILRSDVLRKTGDFSFQTSYSPFSILRCNYGINTSRNWLLYNPSKVLGNVNIGTETSRNQTFRSEFTPRFGAWLAPSVSFAGSYREDHSPELTRIDDVTEVRNVTNSGAINLGVGIPISRLTQLLTPKPAPRDTSQARPAMAGGGLTLAGLLGRVGDIRANHSFSYGSQISRIYGKPNLSYMFGIRRAPGGNSRFAAAGSMTSNIAHTTSMSASSRLFRGVSVDTKFETTGSETEALTGVRVEKKLVWPELRLAVSELEKYLRVGGRIKVIRLDSTFKHTKQESGAKGKASERVITKSDWSPLVSLNATWKNGMSTSFTSHISTTQTDSRIGTAYTSTSTTSNHNFTLQKTLDATKGFSLPFSGKRTIRLKSSVNIGLSVQYSTASSSVPPSLAEKSDDLSVTSNASYSFSANLSGGANLGFAQTRNLQTGVTGRSLRLGFSASFRF
ncbi:MAG: cell surface protein SprA [Candidatus Eisenbacteria bacterium]|nr:cell surface protein SprA [Candidatus Eisenbacteria bacterium]